MTVRMTVNDRVVKMLLNDTCLKCAIGVVKTAES